MEIKASGSIALLATENTAKLDTTMPMYYYTPVIHPETKEVIISYKVLIKDPIMGEVWETTFGKRFGNQDKSII